MLNRSRGIGILIAVLVLGALVVGPMAGALAYFQSRQVTGNHTLTTWHCTLWEQTTQADFEAGTAVNVSTTAIPGSVVLGNDTTFPSVYGLSGNGGTAFSLYNISNSTWVSVAPAPDNVGTGAGLAYTGNGNISATRGGTQTTFWEYNISTNAWRTRAVTPATIRAGGALAYTGDGNISAFRGGATTFYQYNISTNSWTTMANAPASVGAGGSLAYVPANPSVYKSAGTLSSVVNNSGITGATWNSLAWGGSTTPGVTNITFRVRASDTSFLQTNTSLPWVTAGWPSPVTTGLPSGRYFQWQALLTTTDTSKTPRLDDVTLCYA
jgi:hypothetical protein